MSLSVGSRKEAGLEELDITDPSESMEEKAGNLHDETNQNDSQLSTDSATHEENINFYNKMREDLNRLSEISEISTFDIEHIGHLDNSLNSADAKDTGSGALDVNYLQDITPIYEHDSANESDHS